MNDNEMTYTERTNVATIAYGTNHPVTMTSPTGREARVLRTQVAQRLAAGWVIKN